MKKTTKIKILICVFIILIGLLCVFIAIRESLNNIYDIEIEQEDLPLFSYTIYDSKDINNMKVLIAVNSENGIEYVTKPDGNKVYGNGKNKITIDYKVSTGNSYAFEIKEINKEVVNEEFSITESSIESSINLEKVAESQGYKTIEIKNNVNLTGFKTYYQIGKNGEWIQGSGKISMLDYDLTTSNLINEDNTVTITAKVENNKTGDIVTISKEYEVDTTSTISSFSADSLIDAMEKYDFGTGKFKVTVSDQTYNLKVYSFDESQKIEANTAFGAEEDVATASTNAQNMIVVKVNGDLTIEQGATLTAYASKNGYGGPKGMMIYCTGTLTNNGTISMTARGAKAAGQNVYMWKNSDNSYEYVPAQGANGAARVYGKNGVTSVSTNGKNGTNGSNRGTGGGASGGLYIGNWGAEGYSGAGGAGTSYCGGTGGGALCFDIGDSSPYAGNGASNGGAGGTGLSVLIAMGASTSSYVAGGGAGNTTGKERCKYFGYNDSSINGTGENGCGGLLIVYSADINNNGNIQSNGSKGGRGRDAGKNPNYPSHGGGSSGGGSINIFYKGEYSNKGTITAAGGTAVGDRVRGGAGGTGSISVGNISTGTYQSVYKNY